jgi:AcrR family transcriptional regulator
MPRRPTTERLLAAAIEVFSRRGMAATTREIAETAGVNEATLFRQFETKEHLLTAVTAEIVRAQAEALDRINLDDFDLRRDMTRLAAAYEAALRRHRDFIRTMISQPVDPRLAERAMKEVVEPLRRKFLAYLDEGRRRGLLRAANNAAAMDAFTGMIFAYALRSAVYPPGYSRQAYLKECVRLFVEGLGRPA